MKYPVSQPSLSSRERELLLEVFDSGWITGGPMTRRFEEAFEAALNVKHAVAVTSGTTALHLALVTAGVKPGDEVIVPDLTYAATAFAVSYIGARPVFVDIDRRTYCLDVRLTANAITARTRAIVPVHLYGHACDMAEVMKVAKQHGLSVIEDAAEGFGGALGFDCLGTIGDLGCFSFFGNKVLTTGEGGMVVTNDPEKATRLRSLRSMAQHPKARYYHTAVGFNYRMTDLQAAIGVGQLERAEELIRKRRAVCDAYRERLCYDVFVPSGHPSEIFAPWLFTFELPPGASRSLFMSKLAEAGIETRTTFVPMHLHYNGGVPDAQQFPVSLYASAQGVSLPTYPDLPLAAVDEICNEVLKWI